MKLLLCLVLLAAATSFPANIETQFIKAQWQSKTANISLKSKTDHYCYNVQLQSTHQTVPSVGFSIVSLSARMQPQYYLQLRVRTGELSKQMIPISLRVPHLINEWKSLGFSVIVSSRTDIELNTYRLETLSLTGCTQATSQKFLIEAERQYDSNTTAAQVFLNGWELATKELAESENTDFEVMLNGSYLLNQTIYLTVTRSTPTDIYAIYISYFIISSAPTIKFWANTNVILAGSTSSVAVDCSGQTPQLRVYGLSAFSFHMTFDEFIDLYLSTKELEFVLASKSTSSFVMAAVSYVFVSEEQEPQKASPLPTPKLVQQGTLESSVQMISPVLPTKSVSQSLFETCKETQPSQVVVVSQQTKPSKTCGLTCSQGCLTCRSSIDCTQCEKGWDLMFGACYPSNGNIVNNKLTCNDGYVLVDGLCKPANSISVTCQADEYKKNGICLKLPAGALWNGQDLVCKPDYYPSGGSFLPIPEGAVWSGTSLVCKEGYYILNGKYIKLQEGQIFVNGALKCKDGFYSVEQTSCAPVPTNALWNGTALVCKDGYYNSSGACIALPDNTVWNGKQLACKDGFYMVKGACTTLPVGASWDGVNLVCKKGYYKFKDQFILQPPNTVWTGMRLTCADNCENISGNCVQIPLNSFWNGYLFLCKQGFYPDSSGVCQVLPPFCEYVLDKLQCISGYKNVSGSCKPVTGKTTLRFTGKAFVQGKVLLNVRIEGLPADCSETMLTGDFLTVKLVPAELNPSPELTVHYIPGTKGSFSVNLDFKGRTIPPFMVKAGLSAAAQSSSIFATIDTSEMKQIRVDTATMSLKDDNSQA